MGDEISQCQFNGQDVQEFRRRLNEESQILMDWFKDDRFESHPGRCGFELEAWLVDKHFRPSPINDEFLDKISSHLVVPELSKFNFEINSTPHSLEDHLLSHLEQELLEVWHQCETIANQFDSHALTIGILPTIRNDMLTLDNMSSMKRYAALNERVLQFREDEPLKLDIHGKDALRVQHHDVMLEAAATSLQIHLQVQPNQAARYYNLSQIVSAPMVALCANSPFLFEKDLWAETRIPTFEQAVAISTFKDDSNRTIRRVTFGTGYAQNSIAECFEENRNHFPVLLPELFDEDPGQLNHLRLHNGTIWRWTRPLVGIGDDGTPHLRIEHRVPAAGPSITDVIANIGFFIGLMAKWVDLETPLEHHIPFETARTNFYNAAKHGLDAEIVWSEGKSMSIASLISEILLDEAKEGLRSCGLADEEVDHYMEGVIGNRIRTGQNGSVWQRAFIATHGSEFTEMTRQYFKNQTQNIPVHRWAV